MPKSGQKPQDIIGNTYRDRIKGDKAENIELAIASYQSALKVFNQIDFPKDWAGVQNNLGLAYLERIRGNRAENIELAIAAFQAALQVLYPGSFYSTVGYDSKQSRNCLFRATWE